MAVRAIAKRVDAYALDKSESDLIRHRKAF
jgi:hypothetical protein